MIDGPCRLVVRLISSVLLARNLLLATLGMGGQMLIKIKTVASQPGIDPALLAVACSFAESVAGLLQPAIKGRVVRHFYF